MVPFAAASQAVGQTGCLQEEKLPTMGSSKLIAVVLLPALAFVIALHAPVTSATNSTSSVTTSAPSSMVSSSAMCQSTSTSGSTSSSPSSSTTPLILYLRPMGSSTSSSRTRC